MQVGRVERQVVVAAVPEHDVGLGLGLAQDAAVVDARVDDDAGLDVRLVLLALLDRAVVPHEVVERLEPLAGLRREVAVGHRVAHRHDPQPQVAQQPGDVAGGLALAHARAHRGDGDHRAARAQRRAARRRARTKSAPAAMTREAEVHDLGVGEVGVGEHHGVDPLARDERLELRLVDDRDAVRVQRAGELGRVGASVDVGDLGRGEGDHLDAPGRPGTARLKSWKSRPAAPRMTTRSRESAEVDALMAFSVTAGSTTGVRDPPLRCYAGAGQALSGGDGSRTARARHPRRRAPRSARRAAATRRRSASRAPVTSLERAPPARPTARRASPTAATRRRPPARSPGGTARPTRRVRSAAPGAARRAGSRAPWRPAGTSRTTSSL